MLGGGVDPLVREDVHTDILHNIFFQFKFPLVALFAGAGFFTGCAGVIVMRGAVLTAAALPYHGRAALTAKELAVQEVFHLCLCVAGGLCAGCKPVAHLLLERLGDNGWDRILQDKIVTNIRSVSSFPRLAQ